MMNGYGMDGGNWVLMLGVWTALLGLLVFAVARLAGSRSGSRRDEGVAVRGEPSPLDIVDERLARGEIDAETHAALVERLSHGTGW